MKGKPVLVAVATGVLLQMMAGSVTALDSYRDYWLARRNRWYQWRQITPTPTVLPTPRATPTPAPSTNVQAYIMAGINRYRQSQGLGAVTTDSYTCAFAQIRAQEITQGFNHDGFTQRVNNHTLPYPSYSRVTENLAMTSDYTKVVDLWINSPGHAANMRQDTPYVCVERVGNYYAYEGWKP